tara:strand:+ start:6072 stop:8906 length:2835 start_codon:yes stop_codon:yes gene_type:complete
MRIFLKAALFLSIIIFYPAELYSTHIRAGEIIAKRISSTSLTYEFTIIGYTDTGSEVEFGGGKFDFGDGNVIEVLDESVLSSQKILLENQVALNLFKVIHTFQAPGRYVVSYFEQNRNAQIINMENSVDTPFFIETEILIDPFFGLNNTPVLLIPPIDNGIVGIRYIHNPGAFDPDGDSLSYELVIPLQDDLNEVTNYRYPNFEDFYTEYNEGREGGLGPPLFTLDSITGDLIWDAPGAEGEYNFAFRVIEWRKVGDLWFKLGHVTRDMQVIIEASDNERPLLEVLDPICVEAGTLIKDTVNGEDPNFDDIKIEAFGGSFEFISSPSIYFPNPASYQKSPGQLVFEWQTNCSHVRERPYDIQFKITDSPPYGPNLVEFKNWQIQIVAPAPEGLEVTPQPDRTAQISWDPYSCDNADKIQIWRRIGSFKYDPADCEVGIPPGSGYSMIGEIGGDEIILVDVNQGKGLAPGSKYCYRILAEFPLPEGGTSYVSEEKCIVIEASGPVTTKVSIDETDIENGQVSINWIPPFEIDTTLFPKPFRYRVNRLESFNSDNILFNSDIQSDTFFTDTNLNTLESVFNYQVEVFLDNDSIPFDKSQKASTVRAELTGNQSSIEINWDFDVPWSNSSPMYPIHYIYRNNVEGFNPVDFILIDSVDVIQNGFRYLDEGSFEDITLDENKVYCYYIITSGSYENDKLPLNLIYKDKLVNNSQKICAQTNDLTPPCPPVGFKISDNYSCESYFSDKSCEIKDFENRIEWTIEDDPCYLDSKFFNVYFSSNGDNNFKLVGTVNENYFVHKELSNLKGAYYITALDRSGNESFPSDTIRRDNCPKYYLPNVFTPNGDGKNDYFTPFYSDGSISEFNYSDCPRFVKSVQITIVDRTGKEVFSHDSKENIIDGIYINWDGRNKSGVNLPSDTYYYLATVTFDILDDSESIKEIKGWVQILR